MDPFLCKVRGTKLSCSSPPDQRVSPTASLRSHSSLNTGVTGSHWDQVQVGEANQPTHIRLAKYSS